MTIIILKNRGVHKNVPHEITKASERCEPVGHLGDVSKALCDMLKSLEWRLKTSGSITKQIEELCAQLRTLRQRDSQSGTY
jgi:hypothetical protein